MIHRLGLPRGLFFCWILFGCSSATPSTVEVFGRVTWNDAPLPDGDIVFAADDGGPIEDHGRIIDGEYRVRVRPGKKLVRITAERSLGKSDPIMGEAPREQYIPERYNIQTTLTAEVTADGKKEWDYALTASR